LFKDFEKEGLNTEQLIDVYVLQYLFLPMINYELQEFIQMWNNHALRTEHRQTPYQLLRARIHLASAPVEIDEDSDHERWSWSCS
jgi:hypothetical protein